MRRFIDPAGLIFLALLILVLPLRWLLAWAVAAAFHELCHYLAVILCGGWVVAFRVGLGGAQMDAWGLGRGRGAVCTLAGPVGSLLLLLLARWLPAVSLCAAVQSAYNLLPFRSLDGGKALALLLPEKMGDRVISFLSGVILGAVWLLAMYAAFWCHLGPIPLLLALGLQMKTKSVKIPCKPWRFGVQ